MKRAPPQINLKLEVKLQWHLVLFLEHEILEQNLKCLNLRTHILSFRTQKLEKKITKKLKLSQKEEKNNSGF
jgi:hypothetical protein